MISPAHIQDGFRVSVCVLAFMIPGVLMGDDPNVRTWHIANIFELCSWGAITCTFVSCPLLGQTFLKGVD